MGAKGSKGTTKKERRSSVDYKSAPLATFQPGAENSQQTDGVKIEKEVMDFNLASVGAAAGGIIPLNTAIHDTLAIANNNNYAVKYKFEPCFPREFQLTFSPSSATIKPNKTKKIKAKLIIRAKVNINFRVTLNIEGAGSHFIIAKIRCETGVFGVDPSTLDFVDDGPYHVPVILMKLKEALIQQGGLESEGIFRLAGEQLLLKQTKQNMNKGDFTMPNEPNAVATLIKIWFRELPQPLLNVLPPEKIFYSAEIQDCVESLQSLPPLQKALLEWLVDLLLRIAENRKVTKMTAQNLAIVVAPNLYEATTPDPMEGLVMSQKAVQFIHNILIWKIKQREKEVGRSLNADLQRDEVAPKQIQRRSTVDKTVQTDSVAPSTTPNSNNNTNTTSSSNAVVVVPSSNNVESTSNNANVNTSSNDNNNNNTMNTAVVVGAVSEELMVKAEKAKRRRHHKSTHGQKPTQQPDLKQKQGDP